jgi:hypothetical protein
MRPSKAWSDRNKASNNGESPCETPKRNIRPSIIIAPEAVMTLR